MKIRVIDCICPLTNDIDLEARFSATRADEIVNKCIATVTDALKSPCEPFIDSQRSHLIQIFFSMKHAHRAIRELLRTDGNDPMAVNVMPLVRSQLEMLYAICLIIEDSAALNLYLKDGWKRLYIRHLLMRKEGKALPRMKAGHEQLAASLEMFRLASGVTEDEKLTIDEEELGVSLPVAFHRQRIPDFPTPSKAIDRVREASRKRMLQRLYPEYRFLSGYVHFSPASVILSTFLDHRQIPSQWSSSGQKYEIFQKEIAGPALSIDLISAVQSCCEFVSVYPGNMELVRATCEAWKFVAEVWLLGQSIWKIRAQRLLGALS